MAFKSIGIFRAEESNDGWFEIDVSSVLQRVVDGAADVLGNAPGNRVYLIDAPPEGTKAKRVGEVVVRSVTDYDEYEVQGPPPPDGSTRDSSNFDGRGDIGQRPVGEPGEWVVQALIFSRDKFTADNARLWITEHDEYSDYGDDATDAAYIFRQFDAKWFSLFRVIAMEPGVSAAYAQIADPDSAEDRKESADKAFDLALVKYSAVKDMNRAIMNRGLAVLGQSCEVHKAADGGAEERFILGLVLEPTVGDGVDTKPDTQDDVYTAKTIRDAAHGWMENYGLVDLMHSWEPIGKDHVRILESYLAPVDFTIGVGDSIYKVLKGTWLLALRIMNADLWTAIKDGKLGAYSIGGAANRAPLDTEGPTDG